MCPGEMAEAPQAVPGALARRRFPALAPQAVPGPGALAVPAAAPLAASPPRGMRRH
jgi:hypothetical protein